ncbi:MAG: hypothetical protein U0U66_07945 [Cytophagaceae bacterium]
MRYIYGVFLFLFLFAFNANAQYLSTSSTIDITANTTFTGGSLSGSAIVTIKSGAVVTFTGSFSLSNSAQFIIEPGAKVIITTGGLSLSNNAIVTVNGALAVRGGGMSISNNTSISFSGVNKDTIIGNVNFSNNVVTGVGAGTDLYINGNLTASNNSGFDVDGLLAINGSISTSNNTTFTGDGDVTTTGSMVGGNNSNMFGTEPFNCATGPCSGRDFCSAYNNTLSSSTKVGACSGATFTITANTVASSAYLWQSTTSLGSAWSNASGTNNSVNYSSSGLSATTYYRRRMIVSGCTTYSSVVTVYAAPPPAPTASSTPFCGSGTSTLTAYNSPSSYQWYTASSGATSISGATNSTYTTPTISSSTTYYVTSVVGNCESITRTAVTAGPIGPPTVTNNAQCGSGNITLTAFGSPTGVQRWYTAASGGSPVNTTSIYTFWTSTTVTYYVSSVLGACESARVPVTATVLSSLSTPTITTNSPLCAGGTLNLSTGTVAGATYAWTGPNSFTSGAQNPSISPTTTAMSGTYSLTVSASGCTSANATKSVTINTAPAITAQPSTSTQTLCSSATATAISVTATGAGLTYQWYSNTSNSNSGGTIISGATLASYTPSVTGAKYYYCIVSGTCTPAATSNVSGLITINTAPAITAQPSTSTQTLCSSATATAISVTATGAGLSYQWYSNTSNSNSGGTSISGATLASYTPSVTGAKYYYCIVSGTCTPAATSNVSGLITINTVPAAPTAGSNSPVCTGNAINLTASTVSGATYSWTGPNSYTSTTQNPSIASATTAMGGTYSVYSIVSGCTSTAGTVTVTVNTTPSTPSAGSNSPVYEEATINLTASATTPAATSYSWTGPNSFTSSTQNPSITNATIAMGGTYSVTATAANGCTSATGTVVVVVNPLTFSWTGNSNSVWNNTGNWSSGMVPNNTRTVTIPTGRPNYPNLASESGDINNITIQSGASVTIGTGANFTVRGDLTNDGSFTGTGTSRLFLSGSSSGTVSGNSISISNLTMSKSSGSGTLSTTVTVNGAIDLVLGTLNSNGYLILNLDNGYINQGGAGSISGNMTVTRTVSTYRTHYFSVPLDGATVADLTDDAQVFNPTNGMSRLFQYNETTNAWDRITNNVAPLIKGKGYSLYFTAPTVIDITGTYDHSYVHNVTLTNTANTWRFVGNPYPAPINWDAVSGWTKTNLNNAIAFWEGASGQYMYYVAGAGTTAGSLTASSIIPSCVGFWVQTSGTGGATSSLSMTSSVISTTPVVMYRDIDMSNMYSLKLSNGTVTDEAIIRFNDGADPSFEPMVDSKKINNTGTIPSLGSTMLGSTMSINTMPVPTVETEIPLYVKVASNGNYTLTWSNKSNPLYGAQLFLYDKKLGTSTAVVEDVAYTITQSTTDSTNRYVLKLVPAIPITPTTPGTPTTPPQSLTTGTQNALQSSVRVYAKDGKVYVEGVGSGSKEIEGEIITVGGTSLDHFTGVIGEGVSVSRTLTQVSSAVYLVRITSEGQQATYRVVMY